MGRNLPLCGFHRCNSLWIAQQRGRNTEYGSGHAPLSEHPVEAPEPRAGPVFIDALHVHMPDALSSIGTDDFAQKCLGSLITMQDAIFATFFIIDDELNGDPGVLGPLCMRRFRAIAR